MNLYNESPVGSVIHKDVLLNIIACIGSHKTENPFAYPFVNPKTIRSTGPDVNEILILIHLLTLSININKETRNTVVLTK